MFSKRLREMRLKCGLTQQNMADRLGIGLRSYQKYEEGSRNPNLEFLVKIADILNITTDYLLARVNSADGR